MPRGAEAPELHCAQSGACLLYTSVQQALIQAKLLLEQLRIFRRAQRRLAGDEVRRIAAHHARQKEVYGQRKPERQQRRENPLYKISSPVIL